MNHSANKATLAEAASELPHTSPHGTKTPRLCPHCSSMGQQGPQPVPGIPNLTWAQHGVCIHLPREKIPGKGGAIFKANQGAKTSLISPQTDRIINGE